MYSIFYSSCDGTWHDSELDTILWCMLYNANFIFFYSYASLCNKGWLALNSREKVQNFHKPEPEIRYKNFLRKIPRLCFLCTYVRQCNPLLIRNRTLFLKAASYVFHSMAKGNLNKSKETTPTTTTASKYIPRRTKNSIKGNPAFWTFFLSKFSKIFGSLRNFFCLTIHKKLNKSCSLEKIFLFPKKNFVSLKKYFWNFMKWGPKGGISILVENGPLGCYL